MKCLCWFSWKSKTARSYWRSKYNNNVFQTAAIFCYHSIHCSHSNTQQSTFPTSMSNPTCFFDWICKNYWYTVSTKSCYCDSSLICGYSIIRIRLLSSHNPDVIGMMSLYSVKFLHIKSCSIRQPTQIFLNHCLGISPFGTTEEIEWAKSWYIRYSTCSCSKSMYENILMLLRFLSSIFCLMVYKQAAMLGQLTISNSFKRADNPLPVSNSQLSCSPSLS